MISDYQFRVLLVLRESDEYMMYQAELTQRAGNKMGKEYRTRQLRKLAKCGFVSFHKVVNYHSRGPVPRVIELMQEGLDYLEKLDGDEGGGILKAIPEGDFA